VVAVVDEPTTKFAGLVSADLDIAGIAPTMAALVARDPALRVLSYPVGFSTTIVFNSARAPFDDPRVRRAIDALVDRQRIVDVALAGFGTPANSALPDDHPFHSDLERISFAQAESLLDAAGWLRGSDGRRRKAGAPLEFSLLTVGSGDNAIEQLIQADLRSRGITMELRLSEFGAFLAAARANPRRFDALLTGISGDLGLSHLAAMFDGTMTGGALDYAGFHTRQLDSLFTRIRRAGDTEELAALWQSIQDVLQREVPVSWIYHARGVQGVSRRLEGVRMDLRGELATLNDWSIRARARF
jgi:ABC-type transport system substrate-binding protein